MLEDAVDGVGAKLCWWTYLLDTLSELHEDSVDEDLGCISCVRGLVKACRFRKEWLFDVTHIHPILGALLL